MLSFWLHLIALTVYLGSLVGLWFFILSPLSSLKTHEDQVAFLIRRLKIYNPVQIGALGVLVITGAFQLTDMKDTYRILFTREFGESLSLKLLLAFVIIILSTYQSMGVAHRFVRRTEAPEPVSPQDFQSVTRRLRSLTLVIFFFTLITVWVSIKI